MIKMTCSMCEREYPIGLIGRIMADGPVCESCSMWITFVRRIKANAERYYAMCRKARGLRA